jgi:hypothetical protein
MVPILPRITERIPVAKDDDHFNAMAKDKSIKEIPEGSSWGDTYQPAIQAAQHPPQPVLTGAGSNAAQGADVLVENTNNDWINKKWRPAMGWSYMLTCITDFVIFPILWSLLQSISQGSVTAQWQPLTLQGAGLYHIAMGAVLGIAAYGRTKEKVEGRA